MVKLVLLHKADSIYEDEPDVVYDFPRSYLRAITDAVGDWIIYYEPVKAGPRGYFAVAKIEQVIPKPGSDGRFLAMIEPGSFLSFDQNVPRLVAGRPLEEALIELDGTPKKGGVVQRAGCPRLISSASWISAYHRIWSGWKHRVTICRCSGCVMGRSPLRVRCLSA